MANAVKVGQLLRHAEYMDAKLREVLEEVFQSYGSDWSDMLPEESKDA